MHDHLSAATAIQDARRDWTITNWPHFVELEQVTKLITSQEPLAHWPTAQPDEVRNVLDQLRRLAPKLDRREERSLAELDRQEADSDPVRRLETRRDHLHQLATRVALPAEKQAIDQERTAVDAQLRAARRERVVQQTFDRYQPNELETARATRVATLAHDTLTTQPTWVVDRLRCLHGNDQLTGRDIAVLSAWIVHAAAQWDRHGTLPSGWPEHAAATIDVPPSVVEVGPQPGSHP